MPDLRFPSLCLAVLCGAIPVAAQRTTAAGIAAQFAATDVDGDSRAEIERLQLFGTAGEDSAPAVVILVEAGLLARDADGALRERLGTYAADVAAGGFRAQLVEAELQHGGEHQDGRTLIALRRFLQTWRDECGALAGTVLVGRFPDAFLVRTVNWRKRQPVKVGDKRYVAPVPFLRRVPEVVAPRCDLVLADLDGNWEGRYVQGETALPALWAVFPDGVPSAGGVPDARSTGMVRARDFFHVSDGRAWQDGDAVVLDDTTRDQECGDADRARGNPIARPDIAVSRIDARGVAWSPRRQIEGHALFDEHGAPVAVTIGTGERTPHWQNDLWVPDPELELELLCEYFDRNHRYRTTARGAAFKPASIAHGLGSGLGQVRRAAAEWQGFSEPGYDVRTGADLAEMVRWLKRPAVLRTLRAHSNSKMAVFARTTDAALAAELGGPPLCWRADGPRLVPSLRAATRGTRAGFFLYRTLWQNGTLPDLPYLMIHTGCEALAPPGAGKLGYDDPHYGAFAQAEALLFLTPCVAMLGRAKVFYDEPRGACEALRDGATFGDAWRRYFEIESNATSWRDVGGDIGRKRSYFWSLIGDWTVRLQ